MKGLAVCGPSTIMAGMAEISQVALLGLDRAETTTLIEDLGKPAYRAKQLLDAVYRQRVESIGQISTWSHELRSRLEAKGISLGLPRIRTDLYRKMEPCGIS